MRTFLRHKTLIATLTLWVATAFSFAQGIDPDKERDIRRLLELTGGKDLATMGLPGVVQPMADQIKTVVPEDRADEFVKAFTSKVTEVMLKRVTEEFTIPFFDRYFTHGEVKELIEFWGSEVVQRFVQTQLRLVREMQTSPEFRAMLQQGPQLIADILRDMQGDFPELEQFLTVLEDRIDEPEAEGAETLNGTSYVNRTANLRLTVPKGWKLSPQLKASSEALGALISPDESMFVLIQQLYYDGTLADYRLAFEDDPNDETGQKKVGESEVTIDGKPGLRFVLRGDNEGVSVQQMVTVVLSEGVLTSITAATLESNYANAEPVFARLAASYRPLTRIFSEPGNASQAALTDEPPILVSGNVQSSKLIYKVDPVYPEEAKEARIEGTVLLQVTLDEEGNVIQIETLSGDPVLVKSAVEAVRQWGYSPTLLEGEPVPVIAKVSVNFVLK